MLLWVCLEAGVLVSPSISTSPCACLSGCKALASASMRTLSVYALHPDHRLLLQAAKYTMI